MTALLGGSVLLIAVSAAALVYGWLNGEDTFIWGSIVATAASAILVVIAFVRSNKEPAVATGPTGPGPAGTDDEDTTPVQPTPGAAQPQGDEPTQAQASEGEATAAMPAAESGEQPSGEGETTAAMPAGTGAAAAAGDASEDGSAESSETAGDVMGVPSTKKFHRTDCRYATVAGAEPMSRADAEAQGYEPCGVCKP